MDAFAAARSLRGHVSSINVLAFSPDGRLLASGADDNHIIIYDLLSFEQVQRIDGLAPVTSLLWSADVEQLYAGFGDGRVLIVSISLSMHTFEACHLPWRAGNGGIVESLAPGPDPGSLVACVGPHVVIWRQPQPEEFTEETLPLPDALIKQHSSSHSPRLRSEDHDAGHASLVGPGAAEVHRSGFRALPEARAACVVRKGQGIVIGYLRHGIHYWDFAQRTYLWCIDTCVGRLAVSPNEELLALSNLFDGFDVYCLKDQSHLFTISADTAVNIPLPVLFIHAGSALLTGSSSGQARICSAEGEPLQTLACSDKIIQALACWGESNRTQLLATGCSERGTLTTITLWQLEEDSPGVRRSQAPATDAAAAAYSKRKTSGSQQVVRDEGRYRVTGFAHRELISVAPATLPSLPTFLSFSGASTAGAYITTNLRGPARCVQQHLVRFLLRLARYLQQLVEKFIVYIGDSMDL